MVVDDMVMMVVMMMGSMNVATLARVWMVLVRSVSLDRVRYVAGPLHLSLFEFALFTFLLSLTMFMTLLLDFHGTFTLSAIPVFPFSLLP